MHYKCYFFIGIVLAKYVNNFFFLSRMEKVVSSLWFYLFCSMLLIRLLTHEVKWRQMFVIISPPPLKNTPIQETPIQKYFVRNELFTSKSNKNKWKISTILVI